MKKDAYGAKDWSTSSAVTIGQIFLGTALNFLHRSLQFQNGTETIPTWVEVKIVLESLSPARGAWDVMDISHSLLLIFVVYLLN